MKTNFQKTKCLLLILLSLSQLLGAQSTDRNYVRTRMLNYYDANKNYIDKIDYYDGLGRLTQTVYKNVTPNNADLVVQQEYDKVGRLEKTWLPAVASGNNGAFLPFSTYREKSMNTYNTTTYHSLSHKDSIPYSKLVYESSPLNRVLEEYGPGMEWHKRGKSKKTFYLTNSSLACPKYTTTDNKTLVSITRSGNYPSNELSVLEIKDELDNPYYEVRDKQNRMIMEGYKNHYTCYVYDSYGSLRAVLPPIVVDKFTSGTWTENTQLFKDYAYAYKYNSRNHCIAKKLPGADWIYYIYDKADRLILTQDGEQRKNGEWFFSLSDLFDRLVLSGICKNTHTYTSEPFQNTLVKASRTNATDGYKGYSISGITLTNPIIYCVNYYDNYNFMGYNGIPSSTDAHFKIEDTNPTPYNGDKGYEHKGLLTGTLTAQLTGSNSPSYLCSVLYYDAKGRVVQSKSTSHLPGGIEKEYMTYGFTGKLLNKRHIHMASGKATQTELSYYVYDYAERLLQVSHKLNSEPQKIILKNTYDELGRLKLSTAGGLSTLATNHNYTVRSWVRNTTNSFLTETLTFTDNGNISTRDLQASNYYLYYSYSYDSLSRLTNALYSGDGSREGFTTSYTYDKHGNLINLIRYGKTGSGSSKYGLVDNLSFDYANSNQLKNITDSGPNVSLSTSYDFKDYTKGSGIEYSYNSNGALIKDKNKGISSISYNSLNLPMKMDIKSPVAEARNEYTYSARGEKLKLVQKWNPSYSTTPVLGTDVNSSSLILSKTTDYVGNKFYEGGVLKKIFFSNGYYDNSGKKYYFYVYNYLGNICGLVQENGGIYQKTHYYPFGLPFELSSGQEVQPLKYNGKELDMLHGLNQYDYGARYYEPSYGRFTTMDPLAEKYYSISPYAYCLNNPMRFVDPDGREVVIAGDNEFRKKAFDDLQKITSSSLTMLKNGKVIEAANYNEKIHGKSLFTGVGSGDKEFGTSVVSDLIGSEHTVSINTGGENGFRGYTTDAFILGGTEQMEKVLEEKSHIILKIKEVMP